MFLMLIRMESFAPILPMYDIRDAIFPIVFDPEFQLCRQSGERLEWQQGEICEIATTCSGD
jgi:hypothetical protein